jgi:hypothetical protein
MDLTAILILLAIFVGGVIVGYGIRSLVSKKRRERARRHGAYFYYNPEREVTQSDTAHADVHAGKFGTVPVVRSILMTLTASSPRAPVESGRRPADRKQPSGAKGEMKALPLTAGPQWTVEEDTRQAQRINLPPAVADIYRAVADLEKLYPGRKFTPDGRLVGSIGEVIAAEHFGLTLYGMSKAGHDAFDANGDVQIKLTTGNSLSMFTDCTRLIALRIVSPEQAEIVYDGPGAPALAAAGSMQKNGQRKIALTKLRAIAGRALDAGTKTESPQSVLTGRIKSKAE